MKHIAVSSLFALFLIVPSLSGALQQSIAQTSAALATPDSIAVVDGDNQPIVGATVLLGYDGNNPFPGNSLSTDAQGLAAVPAAWKAILPLTAIKDGFITVTLPDAVPGALTIHMTKQESQTEFEVKGDATDYGRLVQDGKIDFGLVLPAMTRQQLLGFDLSMVLSPKTDTLSVAGRSINVPSNISLPKQSESYLFVPINFDKPGYRVYLCEPGNYDIFALRGQFPLSKVIDDFQDGKSMFDMINSFTFTSGGIKNIDVQGNSAGNNLPVNAIPFNTSIAVQAPNLPDDQVMVSLAAMEQNGRLLPTDIKRLTANQSMNLKTNGNGSSVVSVLMVDASAMVPDFIRKVFHPISIVESYLEANGVRAATEQDFSRLSVAILPGAGGVAPKFLQLIDKPTLSGQVLQLSLPVLPAGLSQAGTYITYSEVETITNGSISTERRTRLWEISSPTWLHQVELPKISFKTKPDRTYRWEVIFMAGPTHFVGATTTSNLLDLNSVTHFTRNALDL